ncbi:HEAT repeat domain-containing protein [Nitrosococcus watsonii]|uniref:HEAT repeat domain-containing protein n=1 Tax=Nitrosococcus watsoni (strain C-113) TaxID=105559 RepID=D8K7M5_NITWC|nr:hypothetical protein [Nitrosococcus watsonii]ADJ28902.1 conserved hypothetical protein [Nitrosococcus watsonii C-113]
MNPRLAMVLIIGLPIAVLFLARSHAASPPPAVAPHAKQQAITHPKLTVRYKKGLLSAEIHNVPLAKVLHEFETKAGLQSHFNDSKLADHPISVSVTEVPLAEALKRTLRGFSYALHHTADHNIILLLSTPPTLAHTGPLLGTATFKQSALDPLSNSNNTAKDEPQSLDEFQPLVEEDSAESIEDEEGGKASASIRSAKEEEYNEKLFQRAIAALQSPHKNLYPEAINQLATLDDPRAASALVERVTNDTLTVKERLHAIGALWQHAVNFSSAEAIATETLKELTREKNKNISYIAAQALNEMQQHLQ